MVITQTGGFLMFVDSKTICWLMSMSMLESLAGSLVDSKTSLGAAQARDNRQTRGKTLLQATDIITVRLICEVCPFGLQLLLVTGHWPGLK